MRYIKYTVSALALCAAFAATQASADDQDSSASCQAAAKQISAALENAPQQTADEARREMQKGRDGCNMGLYHLGVQHYAKAMQILNTKG